MLADPRTSVMLLGPEMNSVSLAKSSMACEKVEGPGLRGGSRPRFLCNGGGPFPFAVVVSSLFCNCSGRTAGWAGIGEGGGKGGGVGVETGVDFLASAGRSELAGTGTKDVKGTVDGVLPGAGGARREGAKNLLATAAFGTAVIDGAGPAFGAAFTGRPRFLGAAFAGRNGTTGTSSPAATKTTGRCNAELELPVGPGTGNGRTTGPYLSRFLVSLWKCRSLWMCWTKPVWSPGVLLIGSLQTWQ